MPLPLRTPEAMTASPWSSDVDPLGDAFHEFKPHPSPDRARLCATD
jgi:hypothetical protein